jgi:hypothetical protein
MTASQSTPESLSCALPPENFREAKLPVHELILSVTNLTAPLGPHLRPRHIIGSMPPSEKNPRQNAPSKPIPNPTQYHIGIAAIARRDAIPCDARRPVCA